MEDVMQAGGQWLPPGDYEFIQARVPVLCTDVLVRDAGDPDRVALIRRGTPDGERWCLTGGRVLHDEPLEAAVRRHIRATLGDGLVITPDRIRQAGVFEYFTRPGLGKLHDPRKHAVAVTYEVTGSGPLAAAGEALEARWLGLPELGALEFGFGHDLVIAQLLSHGRAPLSAAG